MNAAKENLNRYRGFLQTVSLKSYREELRDVKWVEQDLPPGIQPLGSIYRNYWDAQNFWKFEKWFENFWNEINTDSIKLPILKEFKKYHFDKDNNGWFKKGFRARMYRTWVSLLTQLDFCYAVLAAAEKIEKKLNIESNEELDRKKIDAKIDNIGFQVEKKSERKEARSGSGSKKHKEIEIITIPYCVYNINEYKRKSESTRVSEKSREAYKKALDSFFKYFILLDNGFVVFGENYIQEIIKNIDDIEKLKRAVDKISIELSGEF